MKVGFLALCLALAGCRPASEKPAWPIDPNGAARIRPVWTAEVTNLADTLTGQQLGGMLSQARRHKDGQRETNAASAIWLQRMRRE